jgi:hypothetical protein
MNTPRGTFSALVSRDCTSVYVIGGFNGAPLNHVEKYNALSNSWEYLAPMKEKRFMHSAALTVTK